MWNKAALQQRVVGLFSSPQTRSRDEVRNALHVRFAKALGEHREVARSALEKGESPISVQTTFSDAVAKELSSVAMQASALAGEAPCGYALLAIGAVPHQTFAPYGHFNNVLLVEDPLGSADPWAQRFLEELRLATTARKGEKNPLLASCHTWPLSLKRGDRPWTTPEAAQFNRLEYEGVTVAQGYRSSLIVGDPALVERFGRRVRRATPEMFGTPDKSMVEALQMARNTYQYEDSISLTGSLVAAAELSLDALAVHHDLGISSSAALLRTASQKGLVPHELESRVTKAMSDTAFWRFKVHNARHSPDEVVTPPSNIPLKGEILAHMDTLVELGRAVVSNWTHRAAS
jgi:hypothetical protein